MRVGAGAVRSDMISRLLSRARRTRWVNVAVVVVRILLGFAFVPSAVKKLLGQPFTDPAKSGAFHDFLDAFHATGGLYRFVGAVQLAAAALLLTQRFATVGALLALPVFTVITVFCWSTGVYPTAAMTTLMWLGTVGLLLWDLDKWRAVLAADDRPHQVQVTPLAAPIDLGLWARCGAAILVVYLASAFAHGGVYRPRGLELDQPAFYVMPLVMLFPVVTFVIDQRRARRAR